MKMIIPGVEWWPQKTAAQQIARVGRICYKSKGKQPDENLSEDKKEDFLEKQAVLLANRFWESGHRSMYRHGTLYFFVKNDSKLSEASLVFPCCISLHQLCSTGKEGMDQQ